MSLPPAVVVPGEAPATHAPPARHHVEQRPTGRRLAILSLTALGIVYGDIGTSPLYAVREGFTGAHGVTPTVPNVYGFLSLIVWALILVVSIKYLVFILRADNRGEGGIIALLALLLQRAHRREDSTARYVLTALGLFGAALLYGEGIITPAISVLGAMEGLHVVTPAFDAYVVPLTVIILLSLFLVQRFGTARVGAAFGPVMLVWFGTIATLGVFEIAREPEILLAVNPWYAARFFVDHGWSGFFILGAVVLVITGAEALYADMGHFGRRPIRVGWFSIVLPCLLLNYFGQGALLLRVPEASLNPFYLLAPRALLVPLLVIATSAAIIASQALISGAFSLAQQSVQLGYLPRLTIIHTSATRAGQIFIPEVNAALMIGTLLLVVTFRSSSGLAAAYGIAVTGTMAISTVLFATIARLRWRWTALRALALAGGFLIIDLSFFSANLIKIAQGGWVPLAVALALFTLMTTWKRGREALYRILRRSMLPFDLFLDDLEKRKPHRVSGTAVFMTSDPEGTPVVLLHHLKHNKVLHERLILMSVTSAEVPEIEPEERVRIERFPHGVYRVIARYGFMESPDVKEILAYCVADGIPAKPAETSFFLGRERLIPTGTSGLSRWRKKLFIIMSRNARSATEFFGIPPNRVVELGAQIEF